jgi:hypothetical protein
MFWSSSAPTCQTLDVRPCFLAHDQRYRRATIGRSDGVGGVLGVPAYCETWGRGPGAVTCGADDDGLVDVAGANQAGFGALVIWLRRHRRHPHSVAAGRDGVPRVNISCVVSSVLAPDPEQKVGFRAANDGRSAHLART